MDVADIISELDDHGFADTDQGRKVAIINDVVSDIDSRNPWVYLRATTSITIPAGNDTPTLPTDFRDAIGITIPAEGTVLQPQDIRAIRKTFRGDTTQGQPFSYYFVGNQLRVYPVPNADYSAVLDYVRNQTPLTEASVEADILLPPRHHRCITLGALARLYLMEDDTELAPAFNAQFETRILTMTEDLTAQQYDRPSRVVDVYDDYDWWG